MVDDVFKHVSRFYVNNIHDRTTQTLIDFLLGKQWKDQHKELLIRNPLLLAFDRAIQKRFRFLFFSFFSFPYLCLLILVIFNSLTFPSFPLSLLLLSSSPFPFPFSLFPFPFFLLWLFLKSQKGSSSEDKIDNYSRRNMERKYPKASWRIPGPLAGLWPRGKTGSLCLRIPRARRAVCKAFGDHRWVRKNCLGILDLKALE